MRLKLVVSLLLTLAVILALFAYMNPDNVWRWTIFMSLCQ